MNDSHLYLTDGERAFLDHFNHETFNHYSGSAVAWLNDQELDWKLMSVFQRWGILHDPTFMEKIDGEEPLAPIEIPWSSREEFLARVQQLLVVYTDLKPLIASSARVEARV